MDVDQFNKGPLAESLAQRATRSLAKSRHRIAQHGLMRAPAVSNHARDARRVTRALTIAENNEQQEYVLVEMRGDLAPILRSITEDKNLPRAP